MNLTAIKSIETLLGHMAGENVQSRTLAEEFEKEFAKEVQTLTGRKKQ
jgi:hypothetical protein